MKKTLITVAAVAVVAGGGYTAADYAVPDSVTVVNTAGGMLTGPGVLAERIYGPYSPPVKKRFGRGKPSTPKHPLGH